MRMFTAMLLLAGALAGCGSGGGSGASAGTATGGWAIKDACSTLPAATVAKTLGATVDKTELSAVRDVPDTYSQCSYELSDGRVLVFGTGLAEGTPPLADQVERARREFAAVSDKPATPVGGVGAAALWSEDMRQLLTFTGDGRYVRTSLMRVLGPMPAEDSKTQQIAVARTVGL